MPRTFNPYQSPLEEELDNGTVDPFPGWTTWKMVFLFFLPAFVLITFLAGGYFLAPILTVCGFAICGVSAISVIIFCSLVHQLRQRAGLGTFSLMALVYLIAQIFSLFLTIALISVVMERFALPVH